METFQARLDRALGNLTELKIPWLSAGELDEMTFKDCFQPKLFYDFVILLEYFVILLDSTSKVGKRINLYYVSASRY